MLLVPTLLWTKSLRSLPGISLLLVCAAIGPLLHNFVEQAPLLDGAQDQATPWLGLLGTLAASLAVWGLQGLTIVRRVGARPVLADTLAASTLVLVTVALAAASLAASGFHLDGAAIPLEALRMGCLAALLVALLPDSPRLAPALVWIPAWVLPAMLPSAPTQLLSPYGSPPAATLAACLGLLLIATASSTHALRDPR